ncbi:hypothetical protein D3C87_770400 [compost metagenome]
MAEYPPPAYEFSPHVDGCMALLFNVDEHIYDERFFTEDKLGDRVALPGPKAFLVQHGLWDSYKRTLKESIEGHRSMSVFVMPTDVAMLFKLTFL